MITTRIRVIDLETTGIDSDDAVVEIAAVDLVGRDIIIVGSDLVRPPVMIPPGASAIHHITDTDVMHCPPLEERLPYYFDDSAEVFAAHNWRFELQWVGAYLGSRPGICTLKCALRVWPDAPGHSNQVLRYYLRPQGLSSLIAGIPHRALPDAYTTAYILRELLELATLEELIAWTSKPALLPRVTFGKHRGLLWSEVPSDYLEWVIAKSDLDENVKFTAEYYLQQRRIPPSLPPETGLAPPSPWL